MESNTSATIDPSKMYNYLNGLATNPIIFAILAVIVLAYVVLFFSLGNSQQPSNTPSSFSNDSSSSSSGSSGGFIFLIAVIVIVLIAYNVLLYFFSIDIMASISNLFHGGNKINIAIQEQTNNQIEPSSIVPEIKIMPQVFNIPGNYYGYEDAQALCSAYGAKLASYDQIEKSYTRGAEWCNYGWSDGQMALFPTQKKTYAKLQETPGHENDCGRPGINGGYMANPALKFGVNCYGYKPKMTNEEEELMQNTQPYPKSVKDILMEKRVDYWQDKLDEILVSPFNYNTWSRI
jgi:hypothetical protein